MPLELTPEQAERATRSASSGLWLTGPAGTGKTAVAAKP